MPKIAVDAIGVALDMYGCPNRCRHCRLGRGVRGSLTEDDLRWVVARFRAFPQEQGRTPFWQHLGVSTWTREPDFSDDYRRLYALEQELSGLPSRRSERGLLSIWRLARDPGYAEWAHSIDVRVCQLTFFGLEEATDWGHRRRGAFRDLLLATERLLAAGIRPRWQWCFTKRIIPDLPGLIELMDAFRLRERCEALGGTFEFFLHCPMPVGEAISVEHLRPVERDLDLVPGWLREHSEQYFRRSAIVPERKLLLQFLEDSTTVAESIEDLMFGSAGLWFQVAPNFDLYLYACEATRAYRLGNLKSDGLAYCLEVFETDRTLGLQALFHIPVYELARRFGRPWGRRLYYPSDLKARWARMWADAECGSVGRGERSGIRS
jgi:hypothetical protein